ncbi:phage endoprotease [Synergistales bacterium]|nr:phage endoprotease [Synergistales bacterium]
MPDDVTGTEQGTGQQQQQGQQQGQGQTSAGNDNADVSLLAGAGAKSSGDKGKDEKTGAEFVTAKDFTLPEGKTFDEELGKSYLDVINNAALSKKEMAQKLLELYSGLQDKQKEAERAEDEKYAAEIKGWAEAARADKEYGGHNWEASSAVIAAGRDHVASPELVKWIEDSRLGNHPEILRMFYRAGKLTAEDRAAGVVGAAKIDPAAAIFGGSVAGLKGYKD